MADEIAWLIEQADPHNPGCVLPNRFLGVRGSFDGFYGSGTLGWLENAADALRFARLKDAAMFIGAMTLIQDGLPHRDTLIGLRDGEPRAIPVEHIWANAGAESASVRDVPGLNK